LIFQILRDFNWIRGQKLLQHIMEKKSLVMLFLLDFLHIVFFIKVEYFSITYNIICNRFRRVTAIWVTNVFLEQTKILQLRGTPVKTPNRTSWESLYCRSLHLSTVGTLKRCLSRFYKRVNNGFSWTNRARRDRKKTINLSSRTLNSFSVI